MRSNLLRIDLSMQGPHKDEEDHDLIAHDWWTHQDKNFETERLKKYSA